MSATATVGAANFTDVAGGSSNRAFNSVAGSPPGYEILAELGRGGMGVVYKARQLALNRTVALKMILAGGHAGPDELKRFLVEAEAVAQLQHPNIVQIFESGQHAGLPFITLEFVAGGSLADKVRQQPLPPTEAARLVEHLARGIAYAHERGIVHRDLKPENVLLAADGTPKITDFGLAKRVESGANLTASGAILGTPSYMAPEQAGGQTALVGPLSDLYALGAVLYRLVAGRPPFQAATPLDTVLQVISTEVVPPSELQPSLPRDLETITLKCLHKEPGRRYGSALALAADLQRFLAGEPIEARPVSSAERAVKWVKRRPLVAAMATVIVLLLVAGTAVSTWFAFEAADRADDAQVQAELAQAKAKEAREERDNARRQREEVRKTNENLQAAQEDLRQALYAAQLNLVQVAWDADNISRVRELLNQLRPSAGQTDLRGFEWHYWNRQSHRELWTTDLGDWDFSAMTFSPDGSRFAAILRSRQIGKDIPAIIRVWPTSPNQDPVTLEDVAGLVEHLRFSEDGKRLTAAVQGLAKMWDARTGKLLLAVAAPGSVSRVSDTADGKHLLGVLKITKEGKTAYAVQVWEAGSGKEIASYPLPPGSEGKVVFSRDGQRFAWIWQKNKGDEKSEVRVTATESGKPLALWLLPVGEVGLFAELTFSPDGKSVAVPVMKFDADLVQQAETGKPTDPNFTNRLMQSARSVIHLWDVDTGKERSTLQGIAVTKVGLAFSPDSRDLAMLDGAAGGVKVWDTATGKEKFADAGRGGPTGPESSQGIKPFVSLLDLQPVFSPDGKLLIATGFGATVRVWDVSQGKRRLHLKGHTGNLAAAAFRQDGKQLYSAGMEGTLKAWDASPAEDPIELESQGSFGIGALAISPDGRRMAVAKRLSGDGEKDVRYELNVLDALTRKPLVSIKVPVGSYVAAGLTFSPDGRRLAAALNTQVEKKLTGDVKVWDASTGVELLGVQAGWGGTGSVVFHPDGERLAACVWQDLQKGVMAVKIWEISSGKPLVSMEGGSPLWNMAFSPSGGVLAVPEVGKDSTCLAFRDTATGQEIRRVDVGRCLMGRVAFSPDGKLFAWAATSGDLFSPGTQVQVMDAATGRGRFDLKVAGQGFLMAFSPDSKRLVTNSGISFLTGQIGNEIKIWHATTGMELTTLRGPLALASTLNFSADGAKLILAGQDIQINRQLLQVWDTTPPPERLPAQR